MPKIGQRLTGATELSIGPHPRRDGWEVARLRFRFDDPQGNREVDAIIEALRNREPETDQHFEFAVGPDTAMAGWQVVRLSYDPTDAVTRFAVGGALAGWLSARYQRPPKSSTTPSPP